MKNRWEISRRAALRGLGVSVALPFLEQMMPSAARAQTAGKNPLRFGAFFSPNGVNMSKLTPTATGAGFALTPTLAPFANLKDHLLVVTGLQNKVAGPHENLHLAGIAACLTTVHPQRDKISISLDQVIANAWRGRTTFPSLELAGRQSTFNAKAQGICEGLPCPWGFTMSYADSKTLKPTETNPQAAFNRLFATGAPVSGMPDPNAERRRQLGQSLLDAVRGDVDRLKGRLGVADKRRMDNYLTSIKELEDRLKGVAVSPGAMQCTAGAKPDAFDADYPARVTAMLDVIALAFQCDRTRVVTYMFAEIESGYAHRAVGVPDAHHSLSHHGGSQSKLDGIQKVDQWHMDKLAYLLGKLKAMPEPGGSVLDNSVFIYTSDVSDGNSHSYTNMPMLVFGRAGGALQSGRHLRIGGDKPTADLYLTLMQTLGIEVTSFGSSTGPLSLA